jgi:DNA-binding winged helix-turn-helix (wHTH) protein
MALSYRFGDFHLDPATRELWRGDAPVAVPPRAFDCIVYLLEHRERAVGRDELIAAVWGRTETGDGTLGQTILAARRALDDTGKEQHAIRTVFRFGYHWVAPVDAVENAPVESSPIGSAPPDAARSATESSHDAPGVRDAARRDAMTEFSPFARTRAVMRGARWPIVFAAAAIALAVLAFVAFERTRAPIAGDAPSGEEAKGSIALVLPVVVNAGSGYDWMRLGLMDLIGARLRAAGMPVVPSDNVVALTGRGTSGEPEMTPARLAEATGATLVVEPRADEIDGRWRVTLRTTLGRDPPLIATNESADVLQAARAAADALARELGFAPAAMAQDDDDPLALAKLSQQIEAAMLSDRLDAARALIASATPAQREQPELRLRAAQIAYQAGDFDEAEAGFDAVANAASAEQDPVLHARAVTNLGVIAAMRDDPALARRRFDSAIAILQRQHASDPLGKALMGRANINGLENHYDAALRDFAEARVAFESTGNLLALAVLDSNLAAMDQHRFRYAEAAPAFARAAQRFATFGVNAAELNALAGAAESKLTLLEPDAALAMEPRLRELVARVADPARKRDGELTRVEILIANGRLREAEAAIEVVGRDAAAADDRAAIVRTHVAAARLADARGDARATAREAGAALQRATGADDARQRARTFRERVRALLESGDVAAAREARDALSSFAEHDGSAPARFYAHLANADAAAASGEPSAASLYAQALADADELRIPLDIREAADADAAWLVASGDLAGASAAAERVSGWAASDYGCALVQLRVQRAIGDETLWRGALAKALALAGERAIPAALADRAAVPPAASATSK